MTQAVCPQSPHSHHAHGSGDRTLSRNKGGRAADLLWDPASYKPVALSSQCPCVRQLHEAKERKERGGCSWLLPCGREHVRTVNPASHCCGPSHFLPFQFHILASRMKMSCYFSSNAYIKYTPHTHTHTHILQLLWEPSLSISCLLFN